MSRAPRASLSDAAQLVTFGPLPEGDRAGAVSRRLRQAIALGLLPDGAQLPSEADLASRFRVSTLTLRESLASLRQQGLLETRRGRGGGSFVRLKAASQDEPFWLRLRELSLDDLRDLRDYHAAISAASAALAAERSTKSAIERLRALIKTLRSAGDRDTRVRADARFHIEIAALSRSARLTRAEIALQGEVAPLLWLSGAEALTPDEAADAHDVQLDTLDARDQARARLVAEGHVRTGIDHLIRLRMDLLDGDSDDA